MGFVSEFFMLEPVGFLALNALVPIIHAVVITLEFKVLAPFAANTVLPMIALDHERVAWAAVVFAFFLHWFIFVIYAECVSLQVSSAPDEASLVFHRCPDVEFEQTLSRELAAQRYHPFALTRSAFGCLSNTWLRLLIVLSRA